MKLFNTTQCRTLRSPCCELLHKHYLQATHISQSKEAEDLNLHGHQALLGFFLYSIFMNQHAEVVRGNSVNRS